MPPTKKRPSLNTLTKAKAGPKNVPAVTGTDVLGASDRAETSAKLAKKNIAVIPTWEQFENYKLGPDGRDIYNAVIDRDVDAGLTTALYLMISEKLPDAKYVVDFQDLVRDLLHGVLYGLLAKRSLPRPELVRHVLAAMIFFAPKEIVPLPVACQLIAQEAIYVKMNPRLGDEFSMRMMCYALGQAVPILQINGSVKMNRFYNHSHESVDAVLRGIGEGMKTATMHVSGNSMSHTVSNAQKLRNGIESGFGGLKTELSRRSLVMLLERFMFWRKR